MTGVHPIWLDVGLVGNNLLLPFAILSYKQEHPSKQFQLDGCHRSRKSEVYSTGDTTVRLLSKAD